MSNFDDDNQNRSEAFDIRARESERERNTNVLMSTGAIRDHAGPLSHADCIYESELLFKRVRTVMENLLAFINMLNHACRHSASLLSHTHQAFSTLCHSGVQHAKSASICDSVIPRFFDSAHNNTNNNTINVRNITF